MESSDQATVMKVKFIVLLRVCSYCVDFVLTVERLNFMPLTMSYISFHGNNYQQDSKAKAMSRLDSSCTCYLAFCSTWMELLKFTHSMDLISDMLLLQYLQECDVNSEDEINIMAPLVNHTYIFYLNP